MIDIRRCGISADEKNSQSKSEVINYKSKYVLQQWALAYTEQQSVKGP